MSKFFRFFEYAYLAAVFFFLYEAYSVWNSENNKAFLYIGFAGIALFMFFFKRRFRKKIAANQKDQ